MIAAHLKKLRLRSDISAEDEGVIRSLVAETRRYSADDYLVRSGEQLVVSMLLLDGWLGRSKDLPSGERQIVELHVPGDFSDLHGFTLKRLDHDIIAITPAIVGIVPHERLMELTDKHPHIARVYWLSTNIDAAITREMALSLGQRPALSRMAHLFCELYLRLDVVGKARGNTFDFPLTQRELSEVLGLTTVHVNRTLQELRRREMVQSENRHITILDKKRLESVAEFDPGYLHLGYHEF